MKNKSAYIKLIKISGIVIITLLLMEVGSYLILKNSKNLNFSKPLFNREISAYYVYKNSPGFKHSTIKNDDVESNVIINKHGFISNQEIEIKKDNKTIRIFITGGSAAFGTGQSQPYDKIFKYPHGVYSFESSIAGQLAKELENMMPNRRFEIVNAASSGRRINQSIAMFLESIKDFSPDIIISIDGMNDLLTINGISPYGEYMNVLFEQFIKLHQISESMNLENQLSIIKLWKSFRFKKIKEKLEINSAKNSESLFNYDASNYKRDDYLKLKCQMIESSKMFTDLILYYNALVSTANAEFIFCLQPMLNRKTNKNLTITEKEMQQKLNPINLSLLNHSFSNNIIPEMEKVGNLCLLYFFDDYLSKQIEELSMQKSFCFIDFNREFSILEDDIDIFTDYCHLTFYGNRKVAKILAIRIFEILHTLSDSTNNFDVQAKNILQNDFN